MRPEGGSWIKEHTSNDFRVDASGTADAYSFTVDWISGYPTAHYDVQIDLYDAATGLLVASAGSERRELAQIPLADQAHDRFVDTSVGSSSGSTTSYEHGGGAISMWCVAALAALALAQVMRQRMLVVKRLRAVAQRLAMRRL